MSCDPLYDLKAAHTALMEAPPWEAHQAARIFAGRLYALAEDQEKRLRALEARAHERA